MFPAHLLILTLSLLSGALGVSLDGIHVDGKYIKNSQGQTVHLLGMNRQGTDYACVQFNKIFNGPSDAASIDAMLAWGPINVVRIPINEDCWLGSHGVSPNVSGINYKNAIYNYVNLLNSKGLACIIDLHWTSGTDALAVGQQPMPNKAQSPKVWSDLTDLFKDNKMVIFDLFNEPAPDDNSWDSDAAWSCWLHGGYCAGIPYETVGSQDLVNVVRERGSTNILMIGGVQYTTSLGKWMQYKPNDPLNNLAASLHTYDFNLCNSRGCWDYYLLPLIEQVPIIVGEVGEIDCDTQFVDDVLPYLLKHGFHPVAFTWNAGGCQDPSLIKDWEGTPTPEGLGFKTFLSAVANGETPQSPESFPVYEDTFTHWVDDWSDARHNASSNVVSRSGSTSFALWPTDSKTSMHVWCWACIDTSVHDGIEFYYNGGSAPYMDLVVTIVKTDQQAKTTQEVGRRVPFTEIMTPTPNSWARGYVRLHDMGLTPGMYDGFEIISTRPQVIEVYFDDISVRSIVDASFASREVIRSGAAVALALLVLLMV